ncbi:hydroxyacid dehydrogenase [archaeon]|jgi:D-lactate dehydrogenase|nr:hydroxyacid dehydrogenase [archaeon]MBT6182357.1 hydroxyacid dehydrogenase [archaeon]MBT6606478.1 hydroxyacid dehydrogenase [archaeon]MBT7251357.1 hydroxyacid dehydrogenase [archaeon]MBT7661161.1 hydroxyacid dehydrogenase [archaeon]
MKKKIGFVDLDLEEKTYFKKYLKGHELIFAKDLKKSSLKKLSGVEILVCFVDDAVDKNVIDSLPSLEFIATRSTGYNHIDVKYAGSKKIGVSNVPVYGENTVAEYTFALILAVTRKIHLAIKRTHDEHSFKTDDLLQGFDLAKKTIGVIGYGSIGKHVVRIAKGFEMNILVCTRHPDKKAAKKVGFRNVTLDNLLKHSDIVSLHIPYTKTNHHLMNLKKLSLMKKSAYLINTARGAIVDTHALMKALRKKKIAGAALDVLEKECDVSEECALLKRKKVLSCDYTILRKNSRLMKMDNVLVSPHNAFNSIEATNRILDVTADNITGFVRGKKLNVVVAEN